MITHFFLNIHSTEPAVHIFPHALEKICLILAAALFLLSVKTCTTTAAQPAACPS